jgi:hypothetical protein
MGYHILIRYRHLSLESTAVWTGMLIDMLINDESLQMLRFYTSLPKLWAMNNTNNYNSIEIFS